MMHSTCFLAASSGMTPPDASKDCFEVAMTLLRTLTPFCTTETAVSSQEVSIARMSIFSILQENMSIPQQMDVYCLNTKNIV